MEVEKKDDPLEEYSSGSNSNPSIDNLDSREILEKVYELDNLTDFEEEKQEIHTKFLEDFINFVPVNQ